MIRKRFSSTNVRSQEVISIFKTIFIEGNRKKTVRSCERKQTAFQQDQFCIHNVIFRNKEENKN